MKSLKDYDLGELLLAVKGADMADEAFAELLSRYIPLIKKRVVDYFGTVAHGSEAMQEARIALHSAAMAYDAERCEGVTFGLYAGVCIANRLKSLMRHNARLREKTEDYTEPEKLSSGVDLEERLATKDMCDRVMRVARAELTEFEYEVFRLSFDCYSIKDIAAMLGKPSKSIENARFRVSRRLRENKAICDILSDIH